jgi:hypothetical protein
LLEKAIGIFVPLYFAVIITHRGNAVSFTPLRLQPGGILVATIIHQFKVKFKNLPIQVMLYGRVVGPGFIFRPLLLEPFVPILW